MSFRMMCGMKLQTESIPPPSARTTGPRSDCLKSTLTLTLYLTDASRLQLLFALPCIIYLLEVIFGSISKHKKQSLTLPSSLLFLVFHPKTFFSLIPRKMLRPSPPYSPNSLFSWPQPPSHRHWMRCLMSCLHFEKIRYTQQSQAGKFYIIQDPFIYLFSSLSTGELTPLLTP